MKTPDSLNILATTAPVIAAVSIAMVAILSDLAYVWPLLGLVVSTLVAPLAKKLASATLPASITSRPDTTGWITQNGLSTGCGLFPAIGTERKEQSGFPSGHATQVFFVAGFFSLQALGRHRKDFPTEPFRGVTMVRIIVLMAVATLVAVQRVASNCHTVAQVIAGAILGLLVAIGSYWVANQQVPGVFPWPE